VCLAAQIKQYEGRAPSWAESLEPLAV